MKDYNKHNNPYATNKGGKINSPKSQTDEPKATVTKKQNDLRSK